jgi:hypothetical protein
MIKQFIYSKLIGFLLAILAIGMIFLAGWLLQLVGKDHGRWQSFTMFLPAVVLFLAGVIFTRRGRTSVSVYLLSGMFFAFGIVGLVIG